MRSSRRRRDPAIPECRIVHTDHTKVEYMETGGERPASPSASHSSPSSRRLMMEDGMHDEKERDKPSVLFDRAGAGGGARSACTSSLHILGDDIFSSDAVFQVGISRATLKSYARRDVCMYIQAMYRTLHGRMPAESS